jgi:hypothetical protein
MTTTGIFIKTWTGDIDWLPYCLESIQKYGSDISEVVIASDASCLIEVQRISQGARVVSVPDWEEGYIQQQWVKLNVFHTPFSPESYMRDGKPILMKTKYGNLGGAEIWKGITEDFVGFEVQYEYMRRLPWMYLSSSLSNFKLKYPHIESHLKGLTTRRFSEFNVLGAYIDKYESDKYFVTDTEEWMTESVARQFWSWGGITSEVKTDIDSYLKIGKVI